jgi:hypothetical protein
MMVLGDNVRVFLGGLELGNEDMGSENTRMVRN